MHAVLRVTRHWANANRRTCFSRGRVAQEVVIDALKFGIKVDDGSVILSIFELLSGTPDARERTSANTRPFTCGLQAKGVVRHDNAEHGDPEASPILLTCFSKIDR